MYFTEAVRACSGTTITAILTAYKQQGLLKTSKDSWTASVQLSLLSFDTWEDIFFHGCEGDGEDILLTLSKTRSQPPQPSKAPTAATVQEFAHVLDEMTSSAATHLLLLPLQGITGLAFADCMHLHRFVTPNSV